MIRRYVLPFALAAVAISQAHAAGQAPSTADYLRNAAQSDEYEIAAGKLAQSRGDAAVKAFGAHMVTDHTKSTQLVTAAAKKSGKAAPPPPMSAEQQKMLAELKAAQGPAFNSAYISQQKAAHQQALALQSGYAESGADANLKAAAAQIVPVVKMHIDMLSKM
jgi:putative membrane protein